MQKTKIISLLRKIASLTLILAFVAVIFPTRVVAQANEITGPYPGSIGDGSDLHGTDTYSFSAGASTHTFVFKLTTALDVGDVIELSFPDAEMSVAAAQTAIVDLSSDGSGFDSDSTTAVLSTDTNTTVNTYKITLSAVLAGSPTWVRITNLTTDEGTVPTTGTHSVHISTFDSTDTDTVVDTGVAMAAVNVSSISVSAVVYETMVFTVDSASLDFTADPSVNAGVDQTQSTQMEIKTNAATYTITSDLTSDGGTQLCLDGSCNDATDTITSTNNLNCADENSFCFNITGIGAGDTAFGNDVRTDRAGYTSSDITNVFYDLDVDYTIKAGTYTGTIAYTALPSF